MENIEPWVRREARTVTRGEVITKAITRTLSSAQAAEIVGVTARHMPRIGWVVENKGVAAGLTKELVRHKREEFQDFSMQHFYEQVCEKRGHQVSYNWVRLTLQEAGVVEKAPGGASIGQAGMASAGSDVGASGCLQPPVASGAARLGLGGGAG